MEEWIILLADTLRDIFEEVSRCMSLARIGNCGCPIAVRFTSCALMNSKSPSALLSLPPAFNFADIALKKDLGQRQETKLLFMIEGRRPGSAQEALTQAFGVLAME